MSRIRIHIASLADVKSYFGSHSYIKSLVDIHDKAVAEDKAATMRTLALHINNMFESYDATPLLEAADSLESGKHLRRHA